MQSGFEAIFKLFTLYFHCQKSRFAEKFAYIQPGYYDLSNFFLQKVLTITRFCVTIFSEGKMSPLHLTRTRGLKHLYVKFTGLLLCLAPYPYAGIETFLLKRRPFDLQIALHLTRTRGLKLYVFHFSFKP